MARLLLGVSGGIAAYKALEVVRLATAEGHGVRVIQTRNAQRFVGAASFAALAHIRSFIAGATISGQAAPSAAVQSRLSA